jgi:hypothetical protein
MIDKVTKKLKHLGRYTSITALLCMLKSERLYLSNFENWKDRTDVAFLKKYAENEKKKIRVLCFSDTCEKNNYWEIYAKYGCMIKFNKELTSHPRRQNNENSFH